MTRASWVALAASGVAVLAALTLAAAGPASDLVRHGQAPAADAAVVDGVREACRRLASDRSPEARHLARHLDCGHPHLAGGGRPTDSPRVIPDPHSLLEETP